jgi:hypothetical protein
MEPGDWETIESENWEIEHRARNRETIEQDWAKEPVDLYIQQSPNCRL